MRATLGVSATETRTIPASLRLVLVAFDVRMWRILDWPRLNLPVPVFLKRLAAPECVFNFGIDDPRVAAVSTTYRVYRKFPASRSVFDPPSWVSLPLRFLCKVFHSFDLALDLECKILI